MRGVDLEIPAGEFTVLVGQSGCGKSTLLRTIAGLEDADRGTIEIGGEVVNHLPPRERDIAMVFQNYALYPYMKVYDNIAFGLRSRKTPKAEIEPKVRRAAQMLGIDHLLDRYPAPAFRRPVAAGRYRARDRAQCPPVPVRRTALQPRCAAARRDARRDQAPAPGTGSDHDLRHPRPDRGDDHGRPHRVVARRPASSKRARRSICSSVPRRSMLRAFSVRLR